MVAELLESPEPASTTDTQERSVVGWAVSGIAALLRPRSTLRDMYGIDATGLEANCVVRSIAAHQAATRAMTTRFIDNVPFL
jgi:hypothetical protein